MLEDPSSDELDDDLRQLIKQRQAMEERLQALQHSMKIVQLEHNSPVRPVSRTSTSPTPAVVQQQTAVSSSSSPTTELAASAMTSPTKSRIPVFAGSTPPQRRMSAVKAQPQSTVSHTSNPQSSTSPISVEVQSIAAILLSPQAEEWLQRVSTRSALISPHFPSLVTDDVPTPSS